MGHGIGGRLRRRQILAVLVAALIAAGTPSSAQTSTPSPMSPPLSTEAPPPLPGAKQPPPIVAPDAPAAPKQPAETAPPKLPSSEPSPAKPPAATAPPPAPDAPAEPKATGDASSAKTLNLEARPVATIKGEADWEEGFKTIMASQKTIGDALAKAKIKQIGHPLTVFRETNDNGFKFETMIPIDPAADTKAKLDSNVVFGQSPAGKALKFQHRGAYEEIDSTYEAITAYLDEKGFDTKNLFIEEYLNSVKTPDDADFQVDIYVLVK